MLFYIKKKKDWLWHCPTVVNFEKKLKKIICFEVRDQDKTKIKLKEA